MKRQHVTCMLACVLLAVTCSQAMDRALLRAEREQRRLARRANKTAWRKSSRNFKSDADVERYLNVYGDDAMIWRCKNAVQPYWDGRPLPLVELYCETLGVLQSAEWHHNGQKIPESDKRVKQTIVPHSARGNYFSQWLDFRLKIYNATTADSGVYTFTAVSIKGKRTEQEIHVDISRKQRRKSDYLRSLKMKRRDYQRYYLFHQRHLNDADSHSQSARKYNIIRTGKNSYYMV